MRRIQKSPIYAVWYTIDSRCVIIYSFLVDILGIERFKGILTCKEFQISADHTDHTKPQSKGTMVFMSVFFSVFSVTSVARKRKRQ